MTTMLVSFDTQFIRRDQKQCKNGEACRASPNCFWYSLINMILKANIMVFYLSCIISRFLSIKSVKKMNVYFLLDDVSNAL